jgi:hypothetical protein
MTGCGRGDRLLALFQCSLCELNNSITKDQTLIRIHKFSRVNFIQGNAPVFFCKNYAFGLFFLKFGS